MVPATEKERQGVLVIRVWTDRGTPEPPRARITTLADISTDEQMTRAVAGMQSILAAVREWLEDFIGG